MLVLGNLLPDSMQIKLLRIVLPDRPVHIGVRRREEQSSSRPLPAVFDQLYIHSPRRWLVIIMAAYLVGACFFAVHTPDWQAPDEPAHYNYIAALASGKGLPVLKPGDYNQDQLELLLSNKFAPLLSIESLRYESYQPPLYYLLATPIYWLSGGSLLALRLFGVLLGAATLALLYFCLELVFPHKTLLPVGATAFSALLPMHMAMNAAVNNDGLSELLLMAGMWVLLRWAHTQFYALDTVDARVLPHPQSFHSRTLVLLGVLWGLGMLTKIYAYLLLPISFLVVVAVIWMQPRVFADQRKPLRERMTRRALWPALRAALAMITPALLLSLPFWVRNSVLYGAGDFLALSWHDQIVVGQPRTEEWITHYGWLAFGERAMGFTFKSFWGVFGWMGVFMDDRIYMALLLFTGVLFLGLLWAVVRFISGGPDGDMDLFQICVLGLFGVILVAVTVGYLWYNVKFVQHQGRYFFWGLLPISALVALGWREVMQPLQGAITGFLAAVLAGTILATGYITGSMDKWTLLPVGVIAVLLLLQPLLLVGTSPRSLRWLPGPAKALMTRPVIVQVLAYVRTSVWLLPFILLFLLDVAIPRLYIIPQLGR